jgi:hypothetical protein
MPGTFDLKNYDDLKFTVAKTLNRNDLTTAIPGFIVLAEAEIRRVVRRKVLRETITLTEEATALPTTCAVLRSVFPRTSEATLDLPLNIGTPEQFAFERARSGGIAGRPTRGFVTDNILVVTPSPIDDFDVEIHFFEKLVPLSANNATNSVLAEAPDIYYFGTLLQAAPYLKNDERVELWRTALDRAVDQLNSVRNEEEASASMEPAELPVVFG